jgi:hypothetical protein
MRGYLKHRPQQFIFSALSIYFAAACLMVDALDHRAFI